MSDAEFGKFQKACNRVCFGAVCLSIFDIADAPWYDYFESDMLPEEAVAAALVDYNDVPFEMLDEVGLGDYY